MGRKRKMRHFALLNSGEWLRWSLGSIRRKGFGVNANVKIVIAAHTLEEAKEKVMSILT